MSFEKNPARDIKIVRGNTEVIVNADGSVSININGEEKVSVNETDLDMNNNPINLGGGMQNRGNKITLDDDETHVLSNERAGFGFIQVENNEEYAWVSWTKEGDVTLIVNSGNVDNADTDGDFCIYDGGDYVYIKNRLGSSKNIKYVIWSD